MTGLQIHIDKDELPDVHYDPEHDKYLIPWSRRKEAVAALRALADEIERREKEGEW